jgi:hypothetical protein
MKHLKMIVFYQFQVYPDVSIYFEQYYKILKLIKLYDYISIDTMAVKPLENESLAFRLVMTLFS